MIATQFTRFGVWFGERWIDERDLRNLYRCACGAQLANVWTAAGWRIGCKRNHEHLDFVPIQATKAEAAEVLDGLPDALKGVLCRSEV